MIHTIHQQKKNYIMVKLRSVFFFFFSSRRRHTRWTGDWSSDVCSSDLRGFFRFGERLPQPLDHLPRLDEIARRKSLAEGFIDSHESRQGLAPAALLGQQPDRKSVV